MHQKAHLKYPCVWNRDLKYKGCTDSPVTMYRMILCKAAWIKSPCLCLFNSSPVKKFIVCLYNTLYNGNRISFRTTLRISDKIIITGRCISIITFFQEHHCIFAVIISRCYIKTLTEQQCRYTCTNNPKGSLSATSAATSG